MLFQLGTIPASLLNELQHSWYLSACMLSLLVTDVRLNVTLRQKDAHTLHMSWEAPKSSEAKVRGYAIQWSKADDEQDATILGNVKEHTFSDLMPGQLISASVCAFSNVTHFIEKTHTGPCSDRQEITLSKVEKGWFYFCTSCRSSLCFLEANPTSKSTTKTTTTGRPLQSFPTESASKQAKPVSKREPIDTMPGSNYIL